MTHNGFGSGEEGEIEFRQHRLFKNLQYNY